MRITLDLVGWELEEVGKSDYHVPTGELETFELWEVMVGVK